MDQEEAEQFQEEDQELDQQPKVVKKKKKKKKKKPKPKDESLDDVNAAGILTQMEEDAAAKSAKRRSGTPATTPGAVAEGDVARSSRRRRAPAAPGEDVDRQAAIQNIEEDLMAKSRNRTSARVAGPGAVSSSLRKSGGDQIMGSGDTTDSAILHHVENEMMEKKRATGTASSTVDASARKAAAGSAGDDAPAFSHMRDMESEDFKASPNGNKRGDEEAPLMDAPAGAGAAAAAGEPPLGEPSAEGEYPGLSTGEDEGEALQAFVAEEEVVEATGVAVLMSEEEEEQLEKRRHKRYLIFGCLAFIVIVIAVVVPVVIVAGGDDGDVIENEPSAAPTLAPSSSPSAAPSSSSLGATVDFLITNGISDPEALSDQESPQFKAADWMANVDPLSLDPNNPNQQARWLQRYRLVTFYFSTGGDDWRECGRNSEGCSGDVSREWLVGEDECEWFSLDCQGGALTVINFNNPMGNFLVGPLPEEFFQLTDLLAFIVSNNDLTGTMSESWGQLTNLGQVFLLGNEFTGTIPEVFWQNLRSLDRVLLGNNNFIGQISTEISTLPLRFLRMENNSMTGPIPDELFDVTSFVELRLAQNSFNGTLSERFGDLTAMTSLQLQDNKFSGPVPAGLDNMLDLRELNLEMNDLTGSISFTLCSRPSLTPAVDCEEVDCPTGCCTCF